MKSKISASVPNQLTNELENNFTLLNPRIITCAHPSLQNLELFNIVSSTIKTIPGFCTKGIFSPDNKLLAISTLNKILVFHLSSGLGSLEESFSQQSFTISDLVAWRWLDRSRLVAISPEGLFVCSLEENQSLARKLFDFSQFSGVPSPAEFGDMQVSSFSCSEDFTVFSVTGKLNGSKLSIIGFPNFSKILKVPTFSTVIHLCNMPGMYGVAVASNANVQIIYIDGNGPSKTIVNVFSSSNSLHPNLRETPVEYLSVNPSGEKMVVVGENGDVASVSIRNNTVFDVIRLSDKIMADCWDEEDVLLMGRSGNLFRLTGIETKSAQPSSESFVQETITSSPEPTNFTSPASPSPAMNVSSMSLEELIQNNMISEATAMILQNPEKRSPQTLELFINAGFNDRVPAIVRHLVELIGKTALLDFESVELASRLIQAKKQESVRFLNDWWTSRKLAPSEKLGDVIKTVDLNIALSIYRESKSFMKTYGVMVQLGDIEGIIRYYKETEIKPDFGLLLKKVYSLAKEGKLDANKPKEFAAYFLKEKFMGLEDISATMLASEDYSNYIELLLRYFKSVGDLEKDFELQTNFLINTAKHKPALLATLLSGNEIKLSNYNKALVGTTLEESSMSHFALFCYDEQSDILRVLPKVIICNALKTINGVDSNFSVKHLASFLMNKYKAKKEDITPYLIASFKSFDSSYSAGILNSVLENNRSLDSFKKTDLGAIEQSCVSIVADAFMEVFNGITEELASLQSESPAIEAKKVGFLKMEEVNKYLEITFGNNFDNSSLSKVFSLLSPLLISTLTKKPAEGSKEDSELDERTKALSLHSLTFLYIKTAISLNRHSDLERICKESVHLKPSEVKDYMLSAGLEDPRPIIYLCDRFGYYEELTRYLISENKQKFLYVYVQKIAPHSLVNILSVMLAMGRSDKEISDLISGTNISKVNLLDLKAVLEERNKFFLLIPILESTYAELKPRVSEEQAKKVIQEVSSVLCIAYISNLDPKAKEFLMKNKDFLNLEEIINACETTSPELCLLCLKLGKNDEKTIDFAVKHGYFSDLCDYLLERSDYDLYMKILSDDFSYRETVIDVLIRDKLSTVTGIAQLSVLVKAFTSAKIPQSLLTLLEVILIDSAKFSSSIQNSKSLQNLALLTAIQHDASKVMLYLSKLSNYDPSVVGPAAEEYGLNEEAFKIYDSSQNIEKVIQILLKRMSDFERAKKYVMEQPNESLKKTGTNSLLLNGLSIKADKDSSLVDISIIEKTMELATQRREILVVNEANSICLEHNLTTLLERYLEAIAESYPNDPRVKVFTIALLAKKGNKEEINAFLKKNPTIAVDRIAYEKFKEKDYSIACVLFEHLQKHDNICECYLNLGDLEKALNAAINSGSKILIQKVLESTVESYKSEHMDTEASVGPDMPPELQGTDANLKASNNKKTLKKETLEEVINKAASLLMETVETLSRTVSFLEKNGLYSLLIKALRTCVSNKKANNSVYTQLVLATAKYEEESLMASIENYHSEIILPTVVGKLKEFGFYQEAVALLSLSKSYEETLSLFIENPGADFSVENILKTLPFVNSKLINFQVISFLFQYSPENVSRALSICNERLDVRQVTSLADKHDCLYLIEGYLQDVLKKSKSYFAAEKLCLLYLNQGRKDDLLNLIEGPGQGLIDLRLLVSKLEQSNDKKMKSLISLVAHLFGDSKKAFRFALDKKDWEEIAFLSGSAKDKNLFVEGVRYLKKEGMEELGLYACVLASEWAKASTMFLVASLLGKVEVLGGVLAGSISVMEDELEKVKNVTENEATRSKDAGNNYFNKKEHSSKDENYGLAKMALGFKEEGDLGAGNNIGKIDDSQYGF